MTDIDLRAILPVLILCGSACLLLLVDLAIPDHRKRLTAALALVGLAAAGLGMVTWDASASLVGFSGMLIADRYSVFLHVTVLIAAAFSVLLAVSYLPRMNIERGEYYVLMMFSVAGMMLMAQAGDLIVIFLALELLSIPLYILSGFARPKPASEESAMKYFLLGAFASGFLLYGIALTYAATGATNLAAIMTAVQGGQADSGLLVMGVGLILVGMAFKVGVVPFHMWTPDVYEGAPSSVTAFMSVGAKVGGFAAVLRVFSQAFPDLAPQWVMVAAILAALTMILGNYAAIAQTNIKRMLAYSSIAHAGYILMAAVSAGSGDSALRDLSISAALFYLLAYALTNLGTWAVVIAMERAEGEGLQLTDYAGLGMRRPALALAMALFMLSLTGLPPTMGFVGKFYVFRAAIEAGFVWLAVIGVLTSLVSAYYYLRVVIIMFMQPGDPAPILRRSLSLTVGLTAIATLVFGLLPGSIMALATDSILALAR